MAALSHELKTPLTVKLLRGRADKTRSTYPNLKRRAALGDLYHYLLTASWPLLMLIVAALFITANLAFALAYFFGGGVGGARPGSVADAFFFSVQTMATIGYGSMWPASTSANLMVAAEALIGLLGLATMTGLVFAKFSRPSARVRFSRYAVVAPRDGVPCLMFRMANLRGNQIVEAGIHVALTRDEVTAEGETMRRFHDLQLSRDRNPIFLMSWTAIHPIDEQSALFGQTRESLAASSAQIVISLTGLDETFSQTIHARHMYQLDDIVWGARFADIMRRTRDGVAFDYARFDEVVPIEPARS